MKLLIVEDDQATLDYIIKGFREDGHAADAATNGPDGLYLATTGSYDIANPSVVPEPATIGLVGIAGLGLFFARRRRI